MVNRNGPIIDMTPDGHFIAAPKPTLGTILLRLLAFGVFLCVGAFLFWTALFMIPMLIILALIGYGLARLQFRGTRF